MCACVDAERPGPRSQGSDADLGPSLAHCMGIFCNSEIWRIESSRDESPTLLFFNDMNGRRMSPERP